MNWQGFTVLHVLFFAKIRVERKMQFRLDLPARLFKKSSFQYTHTHIYIYFFFFLPHMGQCLHDMKNPQVSNQGDDQHIWKVGANILTKVCLTAEKRRSPNSEAG